MTDISRVTSSIVRVRYVETDKMGVVYHANYFVWFEIGRTDWLRDTGWSYREMEAEGLALPVIEAHCEYKRGAVYDDELDVKTSVKLLSSVRVQFEYELMRPADGVLIAKGHTVHVTIDRQGRVVGLPVRVRELFA